MEKLRGDLLNRTLSCYYNNTSDVYIDNQVHVQIAAVAMSVSILALCRLRVSEKMPMLFPITITALGFLCLWISNISAGLFHQRLHLHATGAIPDREQFLNTLAGTAVSSYRLISYVNNLSLLIISMLFYIVAHCAEDALWMPLALVCGSAFRIVKIDSDSFHLKQRLLEVLHECK